MKLSESQIKILQRINENIERGDILAIAAKTGLTRVYVGAVLNPFTSAYNEEIIEAAVSLIAEREQGRKEILKKLPA